MAWLNADHNEIFIPWKCSFQMAVKQIFEDKKSEIYHTVKVFWPRKKYGGKYDMLLNFCHELGCRQMTTDQELQRLIDLLVENVQISSFILRCEWINMGMKQLGIQLDRSRITAAIVRTIYHMRCKYGQQGCQKKPSIFLKPYISPDSQQIFSLTHLRTVVSGKLIERILNFLGCEIYDRSINFSFFNYFIMKIPPDFGVLDHNEELRQLNLKREDGMCIFVVSENQYYECKMASKQLLNEIYVVHGMVSLNSGAELTPSHLYRNILEEIIRSSSHKLNDFNDLNQPNFDYEGTNHSLAELTLKMDLLTRLATHTVKSVAVSVAVKNAAFVMYNYARICVLLESFEEKVKTKLIPSLSSITEVDWSLLKREEEWQIVLLCAKYPDVIMEIYEDLFHSTTFSCHKLMKFLMEFSHCLSVYYNRINILADLGFHLQSILLARIHLIICIKQIMENIFSLLDIKPINKM
ncbi:DALR anticodon-binding domain-containing protein 3 [Chamberlinius hualienensis]